MFKGSVPPFVATVLCAACHGDPSQAPVSKPSADAHAPAAVRRGPTPAELTVGMVEAVTIGASTAPVEVKFDLPHQPVVGQPLEVVVAVMPQVAATSAVVEATGSDGLQLGAGAQPVTIAAVDPTQVYRVAIPVTPSAEGVQFLGLVVSLKLDDATESRAEARSFSVPLIVVAGGKEGGAPGAPGAAGGQQ